MDPNPLPLLHKTALITGASRGIGMALAKTLACAGAHVVIGARSEDSIQQLADTINSSTGDLEKGDDDMKSRRRGKATAIVLDVTDPANCEAFVKKAREVAGIPDYLINNAGMGVFRPIDKFSDDEFEKQFRVNVFGPFYLTRAVVPMMKENGSGHIVNVSSMAGKSFAPMGAGYFASKWAMQGFSKCVFEDVREHGIKVTTVCPGSVDTRFHLDSHPGMHARDQSWMVSPQDVADSILNLLQQPSNCVVSDLDIRPRFKPKSKK